MTFEERAKLIWSGVKDNLDNRGCFNGIDSETMADIDQEQITQILCALGRNLDREPR